MIKGIVNIEFDLRNISKVFFRDNLYYEKKAKYFRFSIIDTNNKYQMETSTSNLPSSEIIMFPEVYDSFSFDTTTGIYTLGEGVDSGSNLYYKGKTNKEIYLVELGTRDPYGKQRVEFILRYYAVENENRYKIGNYIDTVYAEDGTYPDNGIKNGYWYIKTD